MYDMAGSCPTLCGAMEAVLDFFRSYPAVPVFGLLVLGAAGWHLWQFKLHPLLTPKREIDEIVDRLILEHGPHAEEVAYSEEDRAWYDSNIYEQGRWRRIRRELWRRYERGEWE